MFRTPDPMDVLINDIVENIMVQPLPRDTEGNLHLLRELEDLRAKRPTKRLDPNTMLVVGGNLAGLMIVVMYEQRHVLTSSTMKFLTTFKP